MTCSGSLNAQHGSNSQTRVTADAAARAAASLHGAQESLSAPARADFVRRFRPIDGVDDQPAGSPARRQNSRLRSSSLRPGREVALPSSGTLRSRSPPPPPTPRARRCAKAPAAALARRASRKVERVLGGVQRLRSSMPSKPRARPRVERPARTAAAARNRSRTPTDPIDDLRHVQLLSRDADGCDQ